jgi:hypothetical protein
LCSKRKNDLNIQDPHRVVRCAAAPDRLWAGRHNGVFRSTNGARSWDEVSGLMPSSFGFAVAVHPRDPNTAWFVPAIQDERPIPVGGRFTVTRTRDGGDSWQAVSHHLPPAYCVRFAA